MTDAILTGKGYCATCGLLCGMWSRGGAPILARHRRIRPGGYNASELCPGSGQSSTACGHAGMVQGERCVFHAGHAGAHNCRPGGVP